MRLPLLAALLLAACAADPVLLPDSGPCSSACGAGTVCMGGACVAVDSGVVATDTPPVRACAPSERRPCACAGGATGLQICDRDLTSFGSCVCPDAGSPLDAGTTDAGADGGSDAPAVDGAADGGVCPNGRTAVCDGRSVSLTVGERDGGISHFCGSCTTHCGEGEYCVSCRCGR